MSGLNMNTTPVGERASIVIFGCCNAGKSSLINAITSQNIAIVSDIRGTTTDPVKKTMELLPFGPVVITDTPGLDDKSTLGTLRVEKSLDYINQADLILFVVDASREATSDELTFLDKIKSSGKKYLIVGNKCDCEIIKNNINVDIYVSALKNTNIDKLKNMMSQILSEGKKEKSILGNMMKEKDIILLVVPIDASAPKGEVQVNEIKDALERIGNISLVICDSQVFKEVDEAVPEEIPLTSFSIIFANYKGALQSLYSAAKVLDTLKAGDRILISEGCTHHRQCEDIGSVKIPRLVRKHTGLFDEDDLIFEFSTGGEFPKDVSMYKLIIHCGACMLNENQMKTRMKFAKEREIPMTNYGIAIAYMNGILKRAMKPLKNI